MADLMSRSIDLMEATAQGGIGLTRRGYAYCARQPETLAKAVAECESLGNVRHHATLAAYEPAPAGFKPGRRRRAARRASTSSWSRRARGVPGFWPTTLWASCTRGELAGSTRAATPPSSRSSEGGGRHVRRGPRRRRRVAIEGGGG